MPVSGNEETGFKPIAQMSRNYSAGIPIKKRRYPLIWPSSPTPEEQTSLQKEDSGPGQGSSLLNASIGASSSDVNKNSLLEERQGNLDAKNVKMVPSNADNFPVKIEEPKLSSHTVSMNDIDRKEKPLAAGKSAMVMVNSAKTELKLAPIKAPALNIAKDISSEQKVVEKSKSEISKTTGITALSLGLKEHIVSGMGGHNGKGNCQKQDCRESVSLNLCLSKGESSKQCKNDDVESSNSDADTRSNRSNWDLNAPMDAWDGSVADGAACQVTADGLNTIGGTHDVKPLIGSVGMVGRSGTSKEQILDEKACRSNIAIARNLSIRPCHSEDNLHLGLSPSFLSSNLSKKASSSSSTLNSSRVVDNLSLRKAFVLTGNLNKVNISTVKSEPLDESIKPGLKGDTIPMGSLDLRAVKRELVDTCSLKALKSLNVSTLKVVDPRSIKPEPVHECIGETLKKIQGTSNQSDKQMLHDLDIRGKATSSTNFSRRGGVSNCSQHSLNREGSHLSGEVPQQISGSARQVVTKTMSPALNGEGSCLSGEVPQQTSESARQVVTKTMSPALNSEGSHLNGEVLQEKSKSALQVVTRTMTAAVGHDGNESNVSGTIDSAIDEDNNVNDPEQGRLKYMDEVPPVSRGNCGSSASDEEKINLSGDMLEDDPYGSDYDSDGNHDLGTAMDGEQDGGQEEDFEDGEFREPLLDTAMEEPMCETREFEHLNNGGSNNDRMDFVGLCGDNHPSSSYVKDIDTKIKEHGETNNDRQKEFSETTHDEKTKKGADNKDAIFQESSATEMPMNEVDQQRHTEAPPIRPLVILGRKDSLKCPETEQSSDQATSAQGSDENVKMTDVIEKTVSALPKAEASSDDDAAKDANSGGNKSRIINLPRASSMSSPGNTRSISGSSLPFRAGRERLHDVPPEGDKLHPRGRHEIYTDGSQKFSRERYQDQPSRYSRLNFVRGRGRISGRIGNLHGDWSSERDFAPQFYNGPAEFRVPRNKYAPEPDLEFDSYNVGMNGTFVGSGRGGRKLLNDEAPVFRHLPSRRRSPGGRGGPPGRGIEMVRRVPRNVSPSGCIREDDSELMGLRHSEKFMRGLPDDNTDPMYTHSQAPYEGLDGQFVRGSRNFMSMQRRGLPRIRSKSPIGSRTRSPGTWSPPRRRSPDGFGGHAELPNQRSPPMYRMERMRSPEHPCFPGEMIVRGHGSSYMPRPSNELRDMDSGRDLVHPRPVPNRSPSGRVILRNTRRFDNVDPRERTDGNDYFGRPMHPVRFQELGADGTVEERRRFGERRGPVRPFRPPYNGDEGENFQLNVEDGPRPFRFCPQDGSEFHDRGSLREREFDRRIKNRPGNAPRRTRNMEEQEGNFRNGGQVWHDEGFEDMSRIKRKRF